MPRTTAMHQTPSHSQLENLLANNPYLARRRLTFHEQEGSLILSGRVASFFEKQMAQEALRGVEGVNRIDNQLEVE